MTLPNPFRNRSMDDWRRIWSNAEQDSSWSKAIASFSNHTPETDTKGPLAGIPFVAKDLFDFPGIPTTASSTFFSSLHPLPEKAAALIDRCLAQGAVYMGKTHLNEFAYGLSGQNPHFGDCPHPTDPTRLSGGSSSGSCLAVAKGWFPFALSTDTGGSIRVPASFCGLWGVRYVPDYLTDGCFPLAPSFCTVGFVTQTKEALHFVHKSIHNESRNPATLPPKKLAAFLPDWCLSEAIARQFQNVLNEAEIHINEGLSSELDTWMRILPKAFSVLQSMEALAEHAGWIDEYAHQYDPATLQRILRARNWTSEEIEDAKIKVNEFRNWLEEKIPPGTTLVLPAVPCPSPRKEDLNEAFRSRLLALTSPASAAGWPALSQPIASPEKGLTMGLQYVCPDMATLDSLIRNL